MKNILVLNRKNKRRQKNFDFLKKIFLKIRQKNATKIFLFGKKILDKSFYSVKIFYSLGNEMKI